MSSRRRSDPGRARTARRLTAAGLAGLAVAGVWTATAGARPRLEVAAVGSTAETVTLVAHASPGSVKAGTVTATDGDARLTGSAKPVLSPALVTGLVLDTSAAGAGALQAGVNGAANFLLQLPAGARTVVVADGGRPRVLAQAGGATGEALAVLSGAQPAGTRDTGTAVRLAVQTMPPAEGRRLLVLHTGASDAGGEPAAALAARLHRAGVLLAVVATGPSSRYWEQVAGATGGVVVTQRGRSGLGAFDALTAQLRDRYVVTFPAPATMPTTVRLRVATSDGSATADVPVPAPEAAAVASFAPPLVPPAGDGGSPLLLGLVLALVLLAAGGGMIVGLRHRRQPAVPGLGRPAAAPVAPAAAPGVERAVVPPLPRRVPAADRISRRDPASEAPVPLPRRVPGEDRISRRTPEAPAAEVPLPRRGPHATPMPGHRPAASRPEPEPAEADADDRAYARLDSDVGRIAADVVTKRLEFRRGVDRIATATADRPDLLERLIETERRLQGALLGGSPPSGVTLDLLVAARRVIAEQDGGPDRADARQIR